MNANNRIDFRHCFYWSEPTKVSYLQRRIIVYCLMYYENNESCVTDEYYDGISKQLAEMMKSCTQEELEATTYYYVMYDFDSSTGFDIPSRLTEYDRDYLGRIASNVHRQWKQDMLTKQNEV